MAVANYRDVHGHYPPAYLADEDGQPLLSWRVLILPEIEQSKLFDQFNLDEPWDSPNNLSLLDQMPLTYRLHTLDDEESTSTNYVAVVGKETVWQGAEARNKTLSQTPKTAPF